jgi:hypothetical protein
MAAGPRVFIDESQAQKTHDAVGAEFSGWLSFQPLYDKIVREQPDLLE